MSSLITDPPGTPVIPRVYIYITSKRSLTSIQTVHTHTSELFLFFLSAFLFLSLFSCWSSYTQEPLQVLPVLAYSYVSNRVKVRIWVSSHIGGCHQSINREYDSHYKDSHYGMDDHFQVWMFEVPLLEWLNTGSAATSSSNSSAITGYQRMNTSSCCHTVVTGLRSTSLSLPLLAEVNFNKSPGLLRVTLLMTRRPALSIGVSKIESNWQDLTRI